MNHCTPETNINVCINNTYIKKCLIAYKVLGNVLGAGLTPILVQVSLVGDTTNKQIDENVNGIQSAMDEDDGYKGYDLAGRPGKASLKRWNLTCYSLQVEEKSNLGKIISGGAKSTCKASVVGRLGCAWNWKASRLQPENEVLVLEITLGSHVGPDVQPLWVNGV